MCILCIYIYIQRIISHIIYVYIYMCVCVNMWSKSVFPIFLFRLKFQGPRLLDSFSVNMIIWLFSDLGELSNLNFSRLSLGELFSRNSSRVLDSISREKKSTRPKKASDGLKSHPTPLNVRRLFPTSGWQRQRSDSFSTPKYLPKNNVRLLFPTSLEDYPLVN